MASILYIPHGGGPLPLLGDPDHGKLVRFLKKIPTRLGDPAAVLVISAHWEELKPMVTSGKKPGLIYDYSGFPDEAYRIEYTAPGKPELAEQIVAAIKATGRTAWRHSQRGFNHGVYVPLKIGNRPPLPGIAILGKSTFCLCWSAMEWPDLLQS